MRSRPAPREEILEPRVEPTPRVFARARRHGLDSPPPPGRWPRLHRRVPEPAVCSATPASPFGASRSWCRTTRVATGYGREPRDTKHRPQESF
jgi:hypothetical protein